MATDINTILSWFKTGLKPTQTQFWSSWSSFWHKDEAIPQSAISNLAATLNAKAEKDQFDFHKTDPNAHAESIGGKLDKGAFPGTAENLDNRIAALEMPDKVLKYGQINVSGLNLTIVANAFAWVLNQITFLTPGAYEKTITAATDGMYRTDIVAGNGFGGYELIQGTEASTGQAATEPNVPSGKIKVGYVLVFGNTIAKSGNSEGVDLSGELKFAAYPNTRNDGQISMNKVLGTDVNGNLKMFTMAIAPAPYLSDLIPDSYLPNNTGNFILKGSFFTPTMTVAIAGQTVNYLTFKSDNEVHANVTTGATEGAFNVTLNNGISATFPNAMLIVVGTVYKPIDTSWENITGTLDVSEPGAFKITLRDAIVSANIKSSFLAFPALNLGDFTCSFSFKQSPFELAPYDDSTNQRFELVDATTLTPIYSARYFANGGGFGFENLPVYQNGIGVGGAFNGVALNVIDGYTYSFRRIANIMYFYKDSLLQYTFSYQHSGQMLLKCVAKEVDFRNIKLIIH